MGSEGQQDMEMAILTALLKGELSGGRGGAGDPVSPRPRGCWEPGQSELRCRARQAAPGSRGAKLQLRAEPGGFGGRCA